MKIIRIIILGLILLLVSDARAQDDSRQYFIAIYQDLKLATQYDGYGNYPPTTDIAISYIIQQRLSNPYAHFLIFPEVEFANLSGGNYIKATINYGFEFDTTKWLTLGVNSGGGAIYRFGKIHNNINANIFNTINISKIYRIALLGQATTRYDLVERYGTKEHWRFSGFVGLKIRIN